MAVSIAALNAPVEWQVVQDAFLVADDGNPLFVWIDGLDAPADNGLHFTQAVHLFFVGRIVRLYN